MTKSVSEMARFVLASRRPSVLVSSYSSVLASRYPKASALGLSNAGQKGALAPGVCPLSQPPYRLKTRSRHLTGHVRHTRRLSRPCTHIRDLHHVYVRVQHSSEPPAEGAQVQTSSAGQSPVRHRRSNHKQGALRQHLLRSLPLPANEIYSKKGLHPLYSSKA